MLTTSLMTLVPAAASTILAIGPLAALALVGVVATGAVLVGGAIAELRRQPTTAAPAVSAPVSLLHAA